MAFECAVRLQGRRMCASLSVCSVASAVHGGACARSSDISRGTIEDLLLHKDGVTDSAANAPPDRRSDRTQE